MQSETRSPNSRRLACLLRTTGSRFNCGCLSLSRLDHAFLLMKQAPAITCNLERTYQVSGKGYTCGAPAVRMYSSLSDCRARSMRISTTLTMWEILIPRRWSKNAIRFFASQSMRESPSAVQNVVNVSQQTAPAEWLLDELNVRIHRLILCDQVARIP